MHAQSWRRNLYVITISEFIVLVGFSCFAPFMPLYYQQVGHMDSQSAALWTGIAVGGGGLTMFFSAPFWGMTADRWGRKPMVLRTQIGCALIVGLLALTQDVYVFTGIRILMGFFAGTVPAALALVASLTPRDKIPFAMGVVMTAVFAGMTMGPLIGGFMADRFGFQITFIVTAIILLLGGLIVLFFVKEQFEPPAKDQRSSLKDLLKLAASSDMLPLLVVIMIINVGPQMISPVVPLIFSEIDPAGAIATSSGLAFALLGIVSTGSSLVISRLNKRFSLQKILVFCSLGTGLLYLPLIWASSVTSLILLVGLTGLLIGGILTSSNALISLRVPIARQGAAYGLTQSANALGGGLGPFLGGGLGSVIGLRPVFIVTSGVFLTAGVIVMLLLSKKPAPYASS
jgi:MFS transporter, DHA1 family, multidrug resistance protein